jgi:hypothetical protein
MIVELQDDEIVGKINNAYKQRQGIGKELPTTLKEISYNASIHESENNFYRLKSLLDSKYQKATDANGFDVWFMPVLRFV